jgi:hypothetical protein
MDSFSHKIVHIAVAEKFMGQYVEFINTHFNSSEHVFLFTPNGSYPIPKYENVINLGEGNAKIILNWFYAISRARKVILHGLIGGRLVITLAITSRLLGKCYWVVWGGDLYFYQNRKKGIKSSLFEKVRSFVIRRIGHLVTYIKGDYELAKQWYGVKGERLECFMYPSNLYKDYALPQKRGNSVNILVGNSADPTNNHVEIFEKLKLYKDRDIKIFCPLSYGLAEHAERMVTLGNKLFGDKFSPLLDFMPFEKYLELLGQIDIAVFAHKRQQGMGNTIILLGLGKKVYMRADITPWAMFTAMGVKVFDVDTLDLEPMALPMQNENQAHIKKYFSESNLVEQWRKIFVG